MKTITIKELKKEDFQKYGYYANLMGRDTPVIGESPIEFYRDIIQLHLGNLSLVSISVCRILVREPVIDALECHNYTAEGIYSLDSDLIIQAGQATEEEPEIDSIEAFRVPQNTMIVFRPGVWHHAPFVYEKKEANLLVILPERTYKTDSYVFSLPEDQRIKIQF